jgi:uroporphyrin-III C-methyltransferase
LSLDRAIDRLSYQPPRLEPGHVWLAGAGPGDPGCLTLDVVSALSQAEAVVYDALVHHSVLAIADKAELIFAGKRGGRPSMRQDDITDLLIRLARGGRRVLRLKGGDPYVFGRGGEEALALVREGLPRQAFPPPCAASTRR